MLREAAETEARNSRASVDIEVKLVRDAAERETRAAREQVQREAETLKREVESLKREAVITKEKAQRDAEIQVEDATREANRIREEAELETKRLVAQRESEETKINKAMVELQHLQSQVVGTRAGSTADQLQMVQEVEDIRNQLVAERSGLQMEVEQARTGLQMEVEQARGALAAERAALEKEMDLARAELAAEGARLEAQVHEAQQQIADERKATENERAGLLPDERQRLGEDRKAMIAEQEAREAAATKRLAGEYEALAQEVAARQAEHAQALQNIKATDEAQTAKLEQDIRRQVENGMETSKLQAQQTQRQELDAERKQRLAELEQHISTRRTTLESQLTKLQEAVSDHRKDDTHGLLSHRALQQEKHRNEELEQALKNAQLKLDEAEQEVQEYRTEVSNLKLTGKQQDLSMADITSKLHKSIEENDELNNKLRLLTSQNTTLDTEKRNIVQDLASERGIVADLRSGLKTAKSSINTANAKRSELLDELNECQTKLREATAALLASKELVAARDTSAADLTVKMQAAVSKQRATQAEATTLAASLASLQAEKTVLEQKLKDAEEQKAQFALHHSQRQEEYVSEIRELTQILESTQNAAAHSKVVERTAQKEALKATTALQQVSTDRDRLREELRRVENSTVSLTPAADPAQSSANARQVSQLTKSLNSAQQQLADSERRVKECEEQIQTLGKKVAETATMKSQSEIKSTNLERELGNVRRKLASCEQAIVQRNNSIDKMQQQDTQLSSEIRASHRAELDALEKRLQSVQHEMQELKVREDRRISLLATEKETVAKQQQKIRELEVDVTTTRSNLESAEELQRIIDTSVARSKQLEVKLAGVADERATMSQALLLSKTQVSELTTQLVESEKQVEELVHTKKELCTQIVETTNGGSSRQFSSHDLANTLSSQANQLLKENRSLKEQLCASHHSAQAENLDRAHLESSARGAISQKKQFQSLWGESLTQIHTLKAEQLATTDVLEEERRRALLRSQRL